MKRARADISLGRRIRVGQRWWRQVDGQSAEILQVHRIDCLAQVKIADRRTYLRFDELRAHWTTDQPHTQPALQEAA